VAAANIGGLNQISACRNNQKIGLLKIIGGIMTAVTA